jgi:ureidoacrylate peracid hydrolase
VIDMQNDFCDDRGTISSAFGLNPERHHRILAPMLKLIAGARSAGVPVLYTQMVNDPTTESPAWKARQSSGGGHLVCNTGSWGAEFWGVSPAPDDVIMLKHRHTCFYGTNLEVHLRALQRDCLVLTGCNSNVCVEATARDASARDYFAVMVEDCCAAYTDAEHQSAVFNVGRYFGQVVSSEDVMKAWGTA